MLRREMSERNVLKKEQKKYGSEEKVINMGVDGV